MRKTALITLVLSSLLFFGCNTGTSKKNNSGSKSENMESRTQHNQEVHAMINVSGSCEMCKDRIEKTALEVQGVTLASWEMDNQTLHLHYNPEKTTEDEISKALAVVGHDTDKYKADQATYDALPSCCKYRE